MAKAERIVVTGAAGFIGFHLSRILCERGFEVTGIDNLNEYYDVNLKKSRIKILEDHSNFAFQRLDLTDKNGIDSLFNATNFAYAVNLAAQAGVRHSLDFPSSYIESNIQGFLNILEAARHSRVRHLVYASSSSVYGANRKLPFSTFDAVNHPLSLYAATKRANELMAHSYSALFRLPTTGLRFFNAYGPFGRPDMALFVFTKAILEKRPIDVYNNGNMMRDFTYIDDIVEGIIKVMHHIPSGNKDFEQSDPSRSFAPYRIFNIGNNNPVNLMHFIDVLEEKLGRKAIRNFLPMQIGDIPEAMADTSDLMKEVGFKPSTPVEVGISRFVEWYLDYYKQT